MTVSNKTCIKCRTNILFDKLAEPHLYNVIKAIRINELYMIWLWFIAASSVWMFQLVCKRFQKWKSPKLSTTFKESFFVLYCWICKIILINYILYNVVHNVLHILFTIYCTNNILLKMNPFQYDKLGDKSKYKKVCNIFNKPLFIVG